MPAADSQLVRYNEKNPAVLSLFRERHSGILNFDCQPGFISLPQYGAECLKYAS